MEEKIDRQELQEREEKLKKREEKVKKKKEKELEEKETEIRKKQLTEIVHDERRKLEGDETEKDEAEPETPDQEPKDDWAEPPSREKGEDDEDPTELLQEQDRLEDKLSTLEDRYDQGKIIEREYRILTDTYENMLVEIDVGLKRWRGKK
ncbi:hypothetical protein ACFLRC_00715 [Candidatus Altiarchaeota archaeon]